MKAKCVKVAYIKVIKDMYDETKTQLEPREKTPSTSLISWGLTQGSSVISPFLFALVLDKLTRCIHDEVPWCWNYDLLNSIRNA